MNQRALTALLIGAAAFAVACGKEPKREDTTDMATREEPKATESAGTGKIILVEAFSDEKGSYFKPSRVEAHKGDVVRLVLKSGVHNAAIGMTGHLEVED